MSIFKILIDDYDKGDLGEAVSKGDLLYLGTDGKYYKADASSKLKSTTELKLAMSDGTFNTTDVSLLVYGEFTFDDSFLVSGDKYYVSDEAGKITNELYDSEDVDNVVRYIGTAVNESTLLFNPDQTYISDNRTRVNDIPIKADFDLDDRYVSHVNSQNLPEANKSLARENIGAIPASYVKDGKLTIESSGGLVNNNIIFTANQEEDSHISLDLSEGVKSDISEGTEAYSWGDHKLENYLKQSDLTGYATEDWVESQGYITSYEDTTYTAGEGLDLDGNEFSLTQTVLDSLEEAHTHPNKAVIDEITSENVSNWDSAFQDSHTHDNKSVLDGIDPDDISNWDEAYSKSHVHANKTILDSILQGDLDNWDEAYSKAHSHANKTILDGISSSDIEDWEEAYDKIVRAISFTGDTNKTLTVTKEDGSILTASFLDNKDPQFPDDVLNTLTFNDNNDGVLRAITSEGSIIDVSLDGRYSLLGHKHVWEDITDRPTSLSDFTNDLGNYGNWITKAQGDTYYSAIGHTHTFASLTSKPTTIGGYGITDFNSLGDARWALRSRTISAGTGLTGGGNLTANRTIGLSTDTQNDIAKGVTAHGWGNFRDYGLGVTLPNGSWDFSNNSNQVSSFHAGRDHNAPGVSARLNLYGITLRRASDWGVMMGGINDRMFLKFLNNNVEGNWLELWHSGNFDPSNYYTKNESNDRFATKTELNTKENAFSKNTAFNKNFGTGSNDVSRGNHTHTFASLTSKPTTIGGYGITDFNSLGDARWALRTRTISAGTGLTGGGNLTANRTIALSTTTQNDIAKGVTAHGWGDFRDYGLGLLTTETILNQANQHSSLKNSWFRVSSSANSDFMAAGTGISLSYSGQINNQLFIAHSGPRKGIWYRSKATGEDEFETPIKVWDDNNLPNPATQSWVNNQGFVKDLSNYYTKNESLNQFVGLSGVQDIADTKTFLASPVVPNPTIDAHAVNKGWSDDRYARTSHTHNASDINAGTLPVARGGTGSTALGTLSQLNTGTATAGRAWSAKTIADYVKQYTGDNLGLQGVTDIGNWTSNAIDFVNGNDLMFTLNNGTNGSSHPYAPPPVIGTPSLQSISKGFLFVNSSDTLPDYSNKLPYKFGMLDNHAVWANSFTFGSDFGFRFGYSPGINGDWMSIGLDTQLHHVERLANATYISAGGGYYNQRLHFPPENNATLATREWVLEGESGGTPPSGDPTLGLVWDTHIRKNYILRNNFVIDHNAKAIDAVDTTYSGSTSITLSGTSFRRAALTGDVTAAANNNATTIANNAVTHAKYQNIATQRILGRGATGSGNVQELTLGSNLSLSTAGVLSATNTTYSQATLAQLKAGTNVSNRLINPKDFKEAVETITTNNLQYRTDIFTLDLQDYNNYTIIANRATNQNFILQDIPSSFECTVINDSNSFVLFPSVPGITRIVNGEVVSGTVGLKAKGICSIVRYLATNDVYINGDF